jgi:putative ABC transport system permease protein
VRRWAALVMIVRRSMRQHALSTVVTVVAVALACGLVMAVSSLSSQTRAAFTGGPAGFDAVLGARGSQLQLVLNTVFHLETSPGNIPWTLYQEVRRDPRVELAVPYAVGDNYRGFRIVGTTDDLFTRFQYQEGRRFEVEPGGRLFDSKRREAVIGSVVARRTGLRLRSRFNPYHGLDFDPEARHAEEYVVVGVLKPTNSPSDRVIWIPIEGVLRLDGHVLRGAGESYAAEPGREIPDEHKEVSAVMLKLRSPRDGILLDQAINRQGKVATLAWPIGRVMAELFDKLGWLHRVLELVAVLVVGVAAGTILASIHNSMNERRREFAILRALGARRRTVFGVIVCEAGLIALLGSLLGYLVYAGILGTAAVIVRRETGVVLEITALHPVLWITPIGMTLLGALAGLLPAAKAYRTDVADHLAPHS